MMLVSALGVSAVSRITSPSGELLLNVDIDADGSLCYSLDYKGSSLVKESRLGLVSDEADFTHGFKIAGTDTLSVAGHGSRYGGNMKPYAIISVNLP